MENALEEGLASQALTGLIDKIDQGMISIVDKQADGGIMKFVVPWVPPGLARLLFKVRLVNLFRWRSVVAYGVAVETYMKLVKSLEDAPKGSLENDPDSQEGVFAFEQSESRKSAFRALGERDEDSVLSYGPLIRVDGAEIAKDMLSDMFDDMKKIDALEAAAPEISGLGNSYCETMFGPKSLPPEEVTFVNAPPGDVARAARVALESLRNHKLH